MGIEIERKFLVKNDSWKSGEGITIRQGYLSREIERTVRVRSLGEKGFITVKGKTEGFTRKEFEFEIPVEEADQLLNELCLTPLIEKTRYKVQVEGALFEIDEFFGENAGLVVAEIELQNESENYPSPDWLGKEVTDDPRYFNSNLVTHPYSKW